MGGVLFAGKTLAFCGHDGFMEVVPFMKPSL
jgi:hypothetical protein